MKVQNTLIGRASGSIGGVTFATWKGINVAKTKATNVANPNSAGQQLQRSVFALAVATYRKLASFIAIAFSQEAIRKSAYNAFVGVNLRNNAFNPAGGSEPISFANFLISKGSLTPTPISSLDLNIGGTSFTVSWAATVSGDQQSTDQANAVILDPNGNIVAKSLSSVARSAGEAVCVIESGYTSSDAEAGFLFFYQPSSRKVSDSAVIDIV